MAESIKAYVLNLEQMKSLYFMLTGAASNTTGGDNSVIDENEARIFVDGYLVAHLQDVPIDFAQKLQSLRFSDLAVSAKVFTDLLQNMNQIGNSLDEEAWAVWSADGNTTRTDVCAENCYDRSVEYFIKIDESTVTIAPHQVTSIQDAIDSAFPGLREEAVDLREKAENSFESYPREMAVPEDQTPITETVVDTPHLAADRFKEMNEHLDTLIKLTDVPLISSEDAGKITDPFERAFAFIRILENTPANCDEFNAVYTPLDRAMDSIRKSGKHKDPRYYELLYRSAVAQMKVGYGDGAVHTAHQITDTNYRAAAKLKIASVVYEVSRTKARLHEERRYLEKQALIQLSETAMLFPVKK